METVTLWRPTGPKELALVEASGWRAWPARLPDQPIFYPVLNEDYAVRIEGPLAADIADYARAALVEGRPRRLGRRPACWDPMPAGDGGGRLVEAEVAPTDVFE